MPVQWQVDGKTTRFEDPSGLEPAAVVRARTDLSTWIPDLPARGLPTAWLPALAALRAHAERCAEIGAPIDSWPLPYPLLPETLDETLADLAALATQIDLPPVRQPDVRLRCTGTLTALDADRFALHVQIFDPETSEPIAMDGPLWRDRNGDMFVVDAVLWGGLHGLAEGPPPVDPARRAASTSERALWWARLRPSLAGVHLESYLAGLDAVVVDRLGFTLAPGANGAPVPSFDAEGFDAPAFSSLLDTFDPERTAETTLHDRGPDGRPRQRRAVFTPRARRSAHRARQVRGLARQRPEVLAQLADAPETLLDPEDFDLANYSDRVADIGFIVYRVSRSWTERDAEGRTHTRFAFSGGDDRAPTLSLNDADHAELAALLAEAAARGQHYVQFRGAWIRVPSAATLSPPPPPAEPQTEGQLIPKVNLDGLAYAAEDTGDGVAWRLPERPPGLAASVQLLPHQREGVGWLAGHARLGPTASDHGLLADDMGLGKTLQTLSLMAHLAADGELRPTLIVAPVSLIGNWQAEADRFFPGKFTRRVHVEGGRGHDAATLATYDVVLVSYETLRRQQLTFGKVDWKLMVLDESDTIRNPTAQVNRAVLSMKAERRLALSGTPVQNALEDLWAQFDWLCPGFLGALPEFRSAYVKNANEAALADLRDAVSPRLLRRLKEDVVEGLPERHIHRIELPMSPLQHDLYLQVLADHRGADKKGSFGTLIRLFQVCSDPAVVAGGVADDDSPKLRWLLDTLDTIRAAGERVIVFAEWYDLQDRLCEQIGRRFGIYVDKLNGQVESGQRLDKVNRFNRSPGFTVMVLGPKAAGVGLNITGANHVIHFTRHWNPAREAQATDRAYRIGQTKEVHVYLPIVTSEVLTTLEVHLDALLASKVALARELIVPTGALDLQRDLERALDAQTERIARE